MSIFIANKQRLYYYSIMPYVIYGLVDPTTNLLRYIGASTSPKRRRKHHFEQPERYRKAPVEEWKRELRTQGLRPGFIVLDTAASRDEMYEKEVFYISYFRCFDVPLLNVSTGGEYGRAGVKHSNETRVKLSVALKRYWQTQ